MESAPDEVANPPTLQPIELSPSSNTTTTKSNNIGPQQTLERLYKGKSRFIPKLYLVEVILSKNKITFLSMLLLIRNLVEKI